MAEIVETRAPVAPADTQAVAPADTQEVSHRDGDETPEVEASKASPNTTLALLQAEMDSVVKSTCS